MKTKYTPGPWNVQKEYVNDFFGDIKVVDDNYDTVCTMPDNWSIWNSDKNKEAAKEARADGEANAQLIAAAPILLETLKNCLICKPHKASVDAMKDMITAAIEKATNQKQPA